MSQCNEREKYFGMTFDEIFDESWGKFCKGREDHEFKHFNSSMNCYIYGKDHMKQEMKKRRMLPFDVCERLAEGWDKRNPQKKFDSISPKARSIIESLKLSADKNGNIVLGGRAMKALQEIGAMNAPTKFRGYEGGFE